MESNVVSTLNNTRKSKYWTAERIDSFIQRLVDRIQKEVPEVRVQAQNNIRDRRWEIMGLFMGDNRPYYMGVALPWNKFLDTEWRNAATKNIPGQFQKAYEERHNPERWVGIE